MATLQLNIEQVISLVKQLAVPEQRMILQAIKAKMLGGKVGWIMENYRCAL